MTTVALVAFDRFTDVDLFLPWDLLGRVQADGWRVQIVGTAPRHRSVHGLEVPVHAPLEAAGDADLVWIGSGPGARACIRSPEFLDRLALRPDRQLIGSQCSGALILAAKGLLKDVCATTYPTAVPELAALGVEVTLRPLVVNGNVATAGGCMAALYLTSWLIQRSVGAAEARRVLSEVAPAGESERFLAEVEREVGRALQPR